MSGQRCASQGNTETPPQQLLDGETSYVLCQVGDRNSVMEHKCLGVCVCVCEGGGGAVHTTWLRA